jgi:steroid 5-alpha reductase family enzyme
MNSWLLLTLGTFAMSALFVLAWVFAKHVDNYSLVDVVWAFGIGLVSSLWILSGEFHMKQIVALAMVLFWSLRLSWHLQSRIRRSYPHEDTRYAKLRNVWQGRVAGSFFWFFQAQAISVILLSLPFFWIAKDTNSRWGVWENVGLIIGIIGIVGESLADAQMTHFKSRIPDPKAVCKEGLWRYSRHPNYFFEGVIWLGFYAFASGSEWGWTAIHAPVIMIFLLLRVTGIPATEAAALLRKGDTYREYQRNTSAFIPWRPRR